MLLASGVMPLVFCTFYPRFNAVSVLLIIFKFAFISSAFAICVDSFAISSIIVPLAYVNIATDVVECSLAARLA